MMLTSGSRPPTRDMSAGCSIEESLRSRVLSTALMIVGRWCGPSRRSGARSRPAAPGASPESSSEALSGGHVREHERDHLRVLVGDERAQLRGVDPVQELERHLHGRCVEPVDDLRGPVGAERLLEQLLGEGRARPGRCAERAVIMSRNSPSTSAFSSALIESSRAISAVTASTSLSLSWLSTRAARSRPSWISTMAALRTPMVATVWLISAPPASRAGGRRRPRAGARPARSARRGRSPRLERALQAEQRRRRVLERSAPPRAGPRRCGSCSTTYVVASCRCLALRRRPRSQAMSRREQHQQGDRDVAEQLIRCAFAAAASLALTSLAAACSSACGRRAATETSTVSPRLVLMPSAEVIIFSIAAGVVRARQRSWSRTTPMCSELTAPGAISRCSMVVSSALSVVSDAFLYVRAPPCPCRPVAGAIWPSGPTTPPAAAGPPGPV